MQATLQNYRLFRPLGIGSPFYESDRTDAQTIRMIKEFATCIPLGNKTWDLCLRSTDVFQAATPRLNRLVYFAIVKNQELLLRILRESENKTSCLTDLLSTSPPERELVGLLFIARRVYRGSPFQPKRKLPSASGWYFEDYYHLDIIWPDSADPSEGEMVAEVEQKEGDESKRPALPAKKIARIYHNSAGCGKIGLSPAVSPTQWNAMVEDKRHEYFPSADDVILSWQEVAQQLGLHNTPLYVLAEATAAASQGRLANTNSVRLKSYTLLAAPNSSFGVTNPWASIFWDPTWDPADPPPSLTGASMAHKIQRVTTGGGSSYPPFEDYSPLSHRYLSLPPGAVGLAVLHLLKARLDGAGQYLGDGWFRMRHRQGGTLAAGTGQWGSPESDRLEIIKRFGGADPSAADLNTGPFGDNIPTNGYASSLLAIIKQEAFGDEIIQDIMECVGKGTAAECIGCLTGTAGDVFNGLDATNDVLGFLATIITGVLFPVSLPFTAAGGLGALNGIMDHLENGDWKSRFCAGVPESQSPTPTSGTDDDDIDTSTMVDDLTPDASDGMSTTEKLIHLILTLYGEEFAKKVEQAVNQCSTSYSIMLSEEVMGNPETTWGLVVDGDDDEAATRWCIKNAPGSINGHPVITDPGSGPNRTRGIMLRSKDAEGQTWMEDIVCVFCLGGLV